MTIFRINTTKLFFCLQAFQLLLLITLANNNNNTFYIQLESPLQDKTYNHHLQYIKHLTLDSNASQNTLKLISHQLKKKNANSGSHQFLSKPQLNYHDIKEGLAEIKLSNNFGNSYFGNVLIGSNKEKFKMVFDTGSSYNWITQSNCTTCKKSGIKTQFNCKESSTCKVLGKNKKIQYGIGKTLGVILEDKIRVSSLTVHNQVFLSIYEMHQLMHYPADGLIGLGFNTLSDSYPTLLDNMKNQGIIKHRVFSMCLASYQETVLLNEKSYLTIGGSDPRFMKGTTQASCNVVDKYYWAIEIDKISLEIGQKRVFSMRLEDYNDNTHPDAYMKAQYGVIDSGSSIIALPYSDYESMLKGFQSIGLDCYNNTKFKQIACRNNNINLYPKLVFTMCGYEFTISPMQYILCGVNQECIVRFTFFRENLMILGDIFLQAFYTIYDQDQMKIYFSLVNKFHDNLEQTQQLLTTSNSQNNLLFYIISQFALLLIIVIVY